MLVGVDPGREKCGLALVHPDGQLVWRKVVASPMLVEQIGQLVAKFPVSTLIIGNQTTSDYWQAQLGQYYPGLPITAVDERFSSEQARLRYWQFNPPRGLERFIPEGLRIPPQPYDDIVALILLERYLQNPEHYPVHRA
ncbi:MAG: resolvase [Gemmatimonadaceae bacterium]|nr:resolvase [Gloeobacterales cyanobacterium ES-bin-141]